MKSIKYIIVLLVLFINFSNNSYASGWNISKRDTIFDVSKVIISGTDNYREHKILKSDSTLIVENIKYNTNVLKPFPNFLNNLDTKLTDGYIRLAYEVLRGIWEVGSITDTDLSPNLSDSEKKYFKYGIMPILGGVGIGGNFNLLNSATNFRPGHSFEINCLYILGIHYGYGLNSIYSGIGLDWRNFRLSGSEYFDDENGILKRMPSGETYSVDYSNLNMLSVQVPILWKHRFPIWMWDTPLDLSIGPILTITPWASYKTKLFLNSDYNNSIYKLNKISSQRNINVDLMCSLKLFRLGSFYVRYSLLSALKNGSNFNMSPFTAGFILGW